MFLWWNKKDISIFRWKKCLICCYAVDLAGIGNSKHTVFAHTVYTLLILSKEMHVIAPPSWIWHHGKHIKWPQLTPVHEADFLCKEAAVKSYIRKNSWLGVFASKAVPLFHIIASVVLKLILSQWLVFKVTQCVSNLSISHQNTL